MRNSDPVYSFGSSSSPLQPDLSGINEILRRYMLLDQAHSPNSPDMRLLELRHTLLEKMLLKPGGCSDTMRLIKEVNELLADCIYATEDREAIIQECLSCWKKTLIPSCIELCIDSVRLKLRETLSLPSLIDIRFALEHGIKDQSPWEDLLLEKIGPAVTKSDLAPEQMRRTLALIRTEYESALRIATL